MHEGAQKAKIAAELGRRKVRLVKRDQDPLMVFISLFLGKRFLRDFWTTYRLPFCRPVIAYPSHIESPMEHWRIFAHELVHVRQFEPWYGPFVVALLATVFPLPMYYSGRWYIERWAYALDIANGWRLTEDVIEILWTRYGKCWPKHRMRVWFQKHAGTNDDGV